MNLKLDLIYILFTFLARGKLEIINVSQILEQYSMWQGKVICYLQNTNIGCVIGFAEVDFCVPQMNRARHERMQNHKHCILKDTCTPPGYTHFFVLHSRFPEWRGVPSWLSVSACLFATVVLLLKSVFSNNLSRGSASFSRCYVIFKLIWRW
jgi:hypothetical protein